MFKLLCALVLTASCCQLAYAQGINYKRVSDSIRVVHQGPTSTLPWQLQHDAEQEVVVDAMRKDLAISQAKTAQRRLVIQARNDSFLRRYPNYLRQHPEFLKAHPEYRQRYAKYLVPAKARR